jgi:Recombination endonuclease VII
MSRTKEQAREYNRRYYSKHREKCLADAADYYQRTKHTREKQRSEAKLKSKYGITLAQYEQMLEDQHHACACCGTTEIPPKGYWHIDHCHVSGKVRGILCHHCNLGLGHFRDNCATLRTAIAYLEKHNAPGV